MCKHNVTAVIATEKELYKKFGQQGNLDICPHCATQKIAQKKEADKNAERKPEK